MFVGADLNIDRSRQALIDHAIHQAACLEVSGKLGHLAGELLAHALHILIAADAVVLLQAGLHKGRIHRSVGGVDGGEVGVNADIGDDHVQIGGLDHAANDGLHLRDVVVAGFQPRAAGHAHVDDELPWVGAREVGTAQKGGRHCKHEHHATQNRCRGNAGAPHRPLWQEPSYQFSIDWNFSLNFLSKRVEDARPSTQRRVPPRLSGE